MVLLAVLALAAAGFVALGVWQLERRVWKLDLIAQVDARVHAPAVAPPGPSEWPAVSAERDQYRRVQVHGVFLGGPGAPTPADRGLVVCGEGRRRR